MTATPDRQPTPVKQPQTVGEYLKGFAWRWLKLSPVLFLLYLFSIGPMFWYWHASAFKLGGSRFITQLYYPLLILCEMFPWFSRWVNNYIGLWIY